MYQVGLDVDQGQKIRSHRPQLGLIFELDWWGAMKSKIVKRSVTVHRHKSSVSLEDTFWSGLREIARAQGCPVSNLIAKIDKGRQVGNLSSAIRILYLNTSARRRAAKPNPAALPAAKEAPISFATAL